MKKILWVLMIAVMAGMGYYGRMLTTEAHPDYTIVALEFADKILGSAIIHYWQNTATTGGTLLDTARTHTYLDFVFLILYVSLMILYAYQQAKKETWAPLKKLLGVNVYLALLVGGLDITENIMLLNNFDNVRDMQRYVETADISTPKFLLAGWVVLIFLVSLLKSLFSTKDKLSGSAS